MVYNPATDFVGLWRAVGGGVAKEEMPGLDFFISALGRSGLLNVSAANAQPGANQSTTAWFQPAATSYLAEGAMNLWNGAAYVAATQYLLLEQFAAAEKAAARNSAITQLLDTITTTTNAMLVRGGGGVWVAALAGQLPATATNDNANAGNIGENLQSVVAVGAAVAMVSATSVDITTLALTAGDWEVSGQVYTNPNAATTTSLFEAGINTVANTLPTRGLNQSNVMNGALPAGVVASADVGPYRVSAAGAVTLHLVANCTFAVNTNSAYGILRARRVR